MVGYGDRQHYMEPRPSPAPGFNMEEFLALGLLEDVEEVKRAIAWTVLAVDETEQFN